MTAYAQTGRRLGALGAFAALLMMGAAGQAADNKTIKVSFNARLPQAAMYIAQEKGYYKAQGITVDLQNASSAAGGTTIPMLARGDVDVIFGGPSAAMFNAMNEGLGFV